MSKGREELILPTDSVRERIRLVANNPMRIAGLQGVYGDPCGMELIPVSLAEAICLNKDPLLLIDAGSTSPLFEVLGRIRSSCPRAQIIVIGTEADDTYIECIIATGAKGFISANASAAEFQSAIENVRDGLIWAPRQVLSRLIGRHARERTSPLIHQRPDVQLTPRETEVLGLLLGGHGNREIGANLGIDSATVKAHLARIMRKAGVGNRVELTMYALHHQRDEHPAQSRSRRPN